MASAEKSLDTLETVLDMDATSLASAIKQEKISSYEAISTYIDHSKHVNPSINATVEDRYETALSEAREMDNRREQTDKGPLHGVPISIKEAFDVAGMKTTGGIKSRKHLIARNDAEIVSKLKKAGAIILGKTNIPMLCFCQETDNKLYGRTNNPWDLTRTAGGSSGGEGALLGTGGAAAGIGSDIGGSIRFPSHFNGVVGFKPGKFQVSPVGHFPLNAHPLQDRMAGMGPMGKSVRDIELMYQVIATNPVEKQSIYDCKVDIVPAVTGFPLSANSTNILHEIANVLRRSLSVNRIIPPYFEESAQLWQEIMSIDGGKMMKKLAFNHDRPNVVRGYVQEMMTKNTEIHQYMSWALIGAKLFKPTTGKLREITAMIKQGDKTLSDYLKNRMLILPVYHTSAPEHGNVYREIFSIRKSFLQFMPYVAYANVWGLPSLTVPVDTDDDRMPIGVQILSRNGNEDMIFQLGKILEEHFRGYVRCSQLDS
ncbi:MAG TPA: amidase [Lentibacillus sp.]|uniref:amidase n=1 Tax=Lentibacillus sp. TaxID=1925746 RepID=UPI002B4B5912|nr:amidase [Lentibacillus sp.]HLR61053.1 amidase [Lentibacillus sp.]